MKGLARLLSSFVIATWVMTLVVGAIAYALCLGTAEAVTPHDHNPTRSV
ncbi:MAG TPA: hypothetical protein VHE77_09690 [Dongiaceae bacterium]|nr:hypothetical protein [Dongiaceae bacterium]